MNPAVKYTLGRLGLFGVAFALLLPLPLNILVKAMIALVVSAVLSYFLLAGWRNQVADQLGSMASRRAAEKERLRAALAGDEEAAATGDRVALAETKTSTGAAADRDETAESRAATEEAGPPAATESK